jgi:hypothetical protein
MVGYGLGMILAIGGLVPTLHPPYMIQYFSLPSKGFLFWKEVEDWVFLVGIFEKLTGLLGTF